MCGTRRGGRGGGERACDGRGGGLRRVTVRNRSSLPDFLFVVKWAAPELKFHITLLPLGTGRRRSHSACLTICPTSCSCQRICTGATIVSFMTSVERKYGRFEAFIIRFETMYNFELTSNGNIF